MFGLRVSTQIAPLRWYCRYSLRFPKNLVLRMEMLLCVDGVWAVALPAFDLFSWWHCVAMSLTSDFNCAFKLSLLYGEIFSCILVKTNKPMFDLCAGTRSWALWDISSIFDIAMKAVSFRIIQCFCPCLRCPHCVPFFFILCFLSV